LKGVSSEDLLLIGKVIRPHGLNGLIRITSYAQSAESFLKAGIVFLKSDRGKISGYKIKALTPYKNVFFMKLDGISSLENAEKYRGAEILIRKDALKAESEDEYFWFQLIGLEAYVDSGRFIGVLQEIINTGSNDIYVIRDGDKELLVPALHGIILNIDLENKRLIIADNIEGLFDLNEV
jgi:16S rRNA processing protein RimM